MFTSLPYTEPTLAEILSLSGLLLVLSIVARLLDGLCYAGLVAQVIVGALWGTPLGRLLSIDIEVAIQQLGYLGLLLLVAEGGIDTRLDILKAPRNLGIACLVAVTGIALPVGLSLLVLPFGYGYTLLQSFACGAAMSATSLGTILTLLASVGSLDDESKGTRDAGGDRHKPSRSDPNGTSSPSSNLLNTQLGTILIGAALLDDVVGLVMSRIVQVLGNSAPSPSSSSSPQLRPWTVVRPVLASFLLLAVTALCACFLFRPAIRVVAPKYHAWQNVGTPPWWRKKVTTLAFTGSPGSLNVFLFAGVLYVFITIAHYVDSSPLIGAFCAGALCKYVFDVWTASVKTAIAATGARDPANHHDDTDTTVPESCMLSPHLALDRIQSIRKDLLIPFFFCSIGFAIPVREMFSGRVIWRGFIYAGIMALAKATAGAWLLVVDVLAAGSRKRRTRKTAPGGQLRVPHAARETMGSVMALSPCNTSRGPDEAAAVAAPTSTDAAAGSSTDHHHLATTLPLTRDSSAPQHAGTTSATPDDSGARWPSPLLLGLSLIARGEIGFLILGLAQESGLVGSTYQTAAGSSSSSATNTSEYKGSEAYLVTVWALLLNTLAGPLLAGIMVKAKDGRLAREIARGRWGTVEKGADGT